MGEGGPGRIMKEDRGDAGGHARTQLTRSMSPCAANTPYHINASKTVKRCISGVLHLVGPPLTLGCMSFALATTSCGCGTGRGQPGPVRGRKLWTWSGGAVQGGGRGRCSCGCVPG